MARKYLKIVRRVPHPKEEQPAEERPAEERPAEEQLAEEEQPAEQPAEEPLQLLGVKLERDGVPVDPEWRRLAFLIPYYGETEEQVLAKLPELHRREVISMMRRSLRTQKFFTGRDLPDLENASDSEVFHGFVSLLMAESNNGKKRRKMIEGEKGYIELTLEEIKEEEEEKRKKRIEKEDKWWGDPEEGDGWN